MCVCSVERRGEGVTRTSYANVNDDYDTHVRYVSTINYNVTLFPRQMKMKISNFCNLMMKIVSFSIKIQNFFHLFH